MHLCIQYNNNTRIRIIQYIVYLMAPRDVYNVSKIIFFLGGWGLVKNSKIL